MSSSPFHIRVQPTLDPPGLRLRAQETTASDTLAMEFPGALLRVLEPEETARPKIGVYGQWIHVRDSSSREGYVAAWYVEEAQTEETPESQQPSTPELIVPSAQALIDAINAERVNRGLPPLVAHPILMFNAQNHAEYMAAGGGITHFSADGSRPFQRHLAAGYPLAGDLSQGGYASENIVAGPAMTVQGALASWFGDEPHTNTMLSDKYHDCGSGVAVSGGMIYYCFDVARPISGSTARTPPATIPPPADDYVVYVPRNLTSGLRLRKQGNLGGELLRVLTPGEWLAVQESRSTAKVKVGVENLWLKVKDSQGNTGYVAAWLVREESD
jgi:uncharacterized protein YkwD